MKFATRGSCGQIKNPTKKNDPERWNTVLALLLDLMMGIIQLEKNVTSTGHDSGAFYFIVYLSSPAINILSDFLLMLVIVVQ